MNIQKSSFSKSYKMALISGLILGSSYQQDLINVDKFVLTFFPSILGLN